MKHQDLLGRRALVTGGSRGIGAAIARELAGRGAAVALSYSSNQAAALSVVSQIEAAGGRAQALQADLLQATAAHGLVEQAARALGGPLDLLVNSAGMAEFAAIDAVDAEHIDRHFALNVRAPALLSAAFVRQFAGGDGRIVNISSFVAVAPMAQATVYCATKGAIDTLTMGLAQELGARGIRVNAVAPGAIDTDMYRATGHAFEEMLKSRTPLGSIGQPTDIASMVGYLASPQAAWVTGQVFTVNGGIRI